jgi:hypothetical protein
VSERRGRLFDILKSVMVVDNLSVRSEHAFPIALLRRRGVYGNVFMHDLPSKHETNIGIEMNDWLRSVDEN